ncbi:MAG: hypothetical protein ACQERD_06965 [Campylobacterota bacterium]
MNKINPIYILLLFLVVLIISFVKLEESKQNLIKEQKNLTAFNKKAVEFSNLKESTSNKSLEEFINKIRNNTQYKKANLSIVNKSKGYIIRLRAKNQYIHQKLLNDILNSNFKIKSLNIDKSKLQIELSYE